MSANKILIVEDDDIIISGLKYTLESEKFAVSVGKSTQEVDEEISKNEFDLVLLDVTLPDGSGFEACRKIKRKQPNVSIIFLTAIDDEGNVVKGLEMGADDYITKPFRVGELMARIKAVLRRTKDRDRDDIFIIGKVKIDSGAGEVTQSGKEVELTAQEYKLLLFLAQHQGKVLSRAQILENLWDDEGEFVSDNALTAVISRLREKLHDNDEKIIATVRGLGYRAEK